MANLALFRAFLAEQTAPGVFYPLLAADSVDIVAGHMELSGRTVADVGGGAGYFAAEFRRRGATCLLVEPDAGELGEGTRPDAILGDGYWLPLGDATLDVCFSCNVLEHVPDPVGFLDEMVRVTRPGGLIYLSYTAWYGPWGGHETSPWHYLGGGYAARRYTRRRGRAPKNAFGTSLFPLGVARVLRLARGRAGTSVVELRPRYYPRWCRFLVRLPGLRELLTWNLLVVLRREP